MNGVQKAKNQNLCTITKSSKRKYRFKSGNLFSTISNPHIAIYIHSQHIYLNETEPKNIKIKNQNQTQEPTKNLEITTNINKPNIISAHLRHIRDHISNQQPIKQSSS